MKENARIFRWTGRTSALSLSKGIAATSSCWVSRHSARLRFAPERRVEIGLRRRRIGQQAHDLAELGDRLVHFSLGKVDVTQVVVRAGVARIDLDGALILVNRLVEL